MVGSGIGGLPLIEDTHSAYLAGGARKISPFFVPGSIINLVSGQLSIQCGLKGPNLAVVTACTTGLHCIGEASRIIEYGDADVMIAGGTEATVSPLGVGGFAAMRALSTRNDDPTAASRPWDRDRDGFVLGEGAGVLVLEEYEHAKARGAKIYAEVVGYGLSGDAYHVTAPHPEGKGAELAMRMALRKAGMAPGDIDYVNAHGTSTMADTIELAAVKRVLGPDLSGASMSSTKSAIGHLLGGAGAVEAIFCVLAIRDQIVPPTLNLDDPDEGCEGVDLVPHVARKRVVRAVLNNSFGFGGTNASVILKAI
jgi:3-oxoacyl-[acyl-carrier-protein] synthase II